VKLEVGQFNLIPYLTIADSDHAIAFYEAVFGAKVTHKMMAEDDKRIMHATLTIGDFHFMLSGEFPEFSNFSGPDPVRGSSVAVSLRLESPQEVDRIFAKALDHGGTQSAEPQNMFWGDRFAQIVDCAGHRWMLAAKL